MKDSFAKVLNVFRCQKFRDRIVRVIAIDVEFARRKALVLAIRATFLLTVRKKP